MGLSRLVTLPDRVGPAAPSDGAATGTPAGGAPASADRPIPTPRSKPGSAESAAPLPVPTDHPVYVALVVDDLGRSVEQVDSFDALGIELSYAVLPFERLTGPVAARLRERGSEMLVHLPMEPGNTADPGPGALLRTMSPRELRDGVASALEEVEGAVGVNNHMGSALSTDRRAMEVVLDELKRRDLFFLDSRTSAHSVGYSLARSLGLATVERNVFLDPLLEREAIRGQFRRLLSLARSEGAAVGICHPHPITIEVLREMVPAAERLGYRFVPVSRVLERSGVEAEAM